VCELGNDEKLSLSRAPGGAIGGAEYTALVVDLRRDDEGEALEREVQKLSPEELASFRDWFVEYDWQTWDRQIERDAAKGHLDEFVAGTLEKLEHGETREIESLGLEALLAKLR
jgi:hypothetical protein